MAQSVEYQLIDFTPKESEAVNSNTVEDDLLKSVLNNDNHQMMISLDNRLSQSNDYYLKYRYKNKNNENINNKTILTIAVTEETVRPETFGALYNKMKELYGSVDYTDELYYGWELLHYLAKTANLGKLEELLKYIPAEKIEQSMNVLTNFSENALHILLQYEKSNPPFDVLMHIDNEISYGSIVAPENENILKFALKLIDKKINFNHRNFWNESAICLAIRYKYEKLVEQLLTLSNIDLDTCCDSGRSIREERGQEVQECWTQEDPLRVKFNYLKAGDEKNFLKYAQGNIIDVNCFDGNSFNSCGTMLHFCVRKGFVAFLQNQGFNESVATCDIMNSPMLNIFKSKGLARCILFLLDNGANPSLASRKFPNHLLEYSSLRLYYPVVAILLQHRNSKISPTLIFNILRKLISTKLIRREIKPIKSTGQRFYLHAVLCLLLNKLIISFDDNKQIIGKNRYVLNELLHSLDLQSNDRNVQEVIRQVLYLGASLTAKWSKPNLTTSEDSNLILRESNLISLEDDSEPQNRNNKNLNENGNAMAIERLKLNILKMHFDDCVDGTTFQYSSIIHYNETGTDNDDNTYNEGGILNENKIIIHYNETGTRNDGSTHNEGGIRNENQSIIHCNETGTRSDDSTHNENKSLYFLVNDKEKQDLLCHPIMLELVSRKWPKIELYFIVDLIFYAALLLAIYSCVIGLHYDYSDSMFFCTVYYIFWFLVVCHIIKEAIQLFFIYTYFSEPSYSLNGWNIIISTITNYISQSSNIFDMCTVIGSLVTLIIPNIYSSVLAILSGTCVFFIMLGQIPLFTKYTIIFTSIKYTVLYTFFYLILFVSFAISFYLVCPIKVEGNENRDIKNISYNNISKTNSTEVEPPGVMDILTDLSLNLFFTFIYFTGEFEDAVTKPTNYPVFGRVVMTVFIFCMTIILNNLLVGLIISDMDIFEERAKLYKQIYSVRFIEALNTAGKIIQQYCRCFSKCCEDFTVNIFEPKKDKLFKHVKIHKLDNRSREYLKNIKKEQCLNKNLLRNLYDHIVFDTIS